MKRLAVVALRLAVGGIFLYAGILKAWDPAGFSTDVQNYRLLPYAAAVAVALYLPWLEILAGACVMVKKFYPGSLAILLGLMVFFTGALILAWARGLDISCGCFGRTDGAANYPWFLARDLAILSACAALFLLNSPGKSDTPSPC